MGNLQTFQFTNEGNVQREVTEHFQKLVLYSKEVWKRNRTLKDTYEGMYSFVSTKHYPLVKKYSTVNNKDFPYMWQYMKTTEDGAFSRDNSVIYLKGMDPKSQVLSYLSTIV